jgi:hypothetical protein
VGDARLFPEERGGYIFGRRRHAVPLRRRDLGRSDELGSARVGPVGAAGPGGVGYRGRTATAPSRGLEVVSLVLEVRPATDGPVRVGQELHGHIIARSDTGIEVRRLTLVVGWRTEGDGNKATGVTHTVEMLEAPTRLIRGEAREIPFRFIAPPGPVSYQGTRLRVVNFVRATADIRWARDPAGEWTYDLRPAPDQVEAFQGPLLDPSSAHNGPARIQARPKPVEVALAVIAAVLGVALGTAAVMSGASPPLLAILLGISGPLVGAALLLPFRAQIAERRLGRVEVVLDRAAVAPGQTIRAALSFLPRSDLRIQRATATLRGREKVVRGSGKERVTRQHAFTHAEAPLVAEAVLPAGHRVTLWAPLPLAPDCPLSFCARDNRLDWEVEVRIAIAGWPDWVAVHPVLVWPAAPAASSETPA